MAKRLQAAGREILKARRENHKGEAVVDGVKPKRGMLIVNHARRRVYGLIWQVRRSGALVWNPLMGVGSIDRPTVTMIETPAETVHRNGASYVEELPDGYAILSDGGFVCAS